jgi:hypothetical protein
MSARPIVGGEKEREKSPLSHGARLKLKHKRLIQLRCGKFKSLGNIEQVRELLKEPVFVENSRMILH